MSTPLLEGTSDPTWRSRRHRRAVVAATLAALSCAAGCDVFDVGDAVKSCNLVTHSGCDAQEACVSAERPRCMNIGKIAVDQPCVGVADCTREAICVGDDNTKHCRLRCDLAAPSCTSGTTCMTPTTALNPSGLGVCVVPECDPVGQTGCDASSRCIPGPRPYCTQVQGVSGEGKSCKTSEGCKTGLVCAESSDGSNQCIVVCTTEKSPPDNGCGEEFSCSALLDGDGHRLPAGQGTCVLTHCNALTDAGCKDSEKCFAAATPLCSFPGNAQLDEPCVQVKDCGVGLICLQGEVRHQRRERAIRVP
jgi:hypothetical protein